jgi:hypothetical protein
MAGTGWDAAAHRRECTIPPDQLKALNALPGWERTFQAAPLDETPDDSPASSQQGARAKRVSLVPEKTKSAQVKVAAPSPGAHARRQRAPVLSFDDEDEEEEEEENARKRADALVRAGRGDANPEMADPQTFGLRGVASAPPRAEHFANDDALRLDASLLPAMERQGLAMAFSPARTRGRAAKAERVSQRRAEAETDALEDIMPTQAADPEAQRDAARGAAAALATLFSPVGTRASRRRKLQAPGETKAEGYEMADSRIEEEAIAPTQAEPEPERRKTRGVLAAALDAVRGAVGLRAGASDPEPPSSSRRVSALPETSGGEPGTEPDVRRAGSSPVAEKAIRSPFAGRHRRRRLDDAREDARWDSFARLVDKSLVDASPPITQKTAEPTMAPSAAAAVVDAVAAAAADGPTSPRRATSAFGDQGGDAPDFRGTHNERDARVALGRVSSPGGGARVDLASSLVASRFSTGKKRKRSGIGSGPSGRAPPAPTASPASRVVPVAEAARAASPGLLTAEPASAAPEQRSVSPADALLAARFSGKKRRRNREKAVAERSSGGLGAPAAPLRGVDALVDVDGDGTGTDGAPWYAGGTAEKPEKPEKISSKKQERVTRAKAGVNKRAGAPESKRRDARDPAPARSNRTRRGASDRAEEEFAAVLADLADATETRADADAKREAAAAKSAVARPPSSVARAISFEETWEGREKDSFSREKEKEKETPADALALFGGVVPRFRGKRQVSASTPRRTPAVGVPAPKTKARDPRRSAMSLLRLGD